MHPDITEIERQAHKSLFSNGKPDTGLLDQVHDFLGRFLAYPSEHGHIAHALWIAHTHFMDAWESTPRIAFQGALCAVWNARPRQPGASDVREEGVKGIGASQRGVY